MAKCRAYLIFFMCAVWNSSIIINGNSVDVERIASLQPNETKLVEGDIVPLEDNVTSINTTFSERLIIFMFTAKVFTLNITVPCNAVGKNYSVMLTSESDHIFNVVDREKYVFTCSSLNEDDSANTSSFIGILDGSIQLKLVGKLLGISSLKLEIRHTEVIPAVYETTSSSFRVRNEEITGNVTLFKAEFPVTVLRNIRLIDKIFMGFITVFLIAITMGFGCKLDLGIVKECIKKPIAPGIGLGCQYLVMPLLGFAIAKLLPMNADRSVALGIFVCGVCPGGGSSNIYSYLLDGDVSLSITMTFLSTIASIGMMPLWIYTLGRLFVQDGYNITIPYINLLQVTALVTIPLLVGIFIKYKYLKVALTIIKVLKPTTIVAILVFTSLGVYSNLFIFKLFRPLHILAGCLLPYLGYLLGGIIAAIFRLPFDRVKTIALETGMQNVGVAYILMISSFPPPHGDLASVAPMASGVMTPFPPLIVTIIYLIYKKCCKRYEPVNLHEQEVMVNTSSKIYVENKGLNVTEKISSV